MEYTVLWNQNLMHGKNKNELPDQIKRLREYPQVQGSIFFSSSTFNSNPNGWNDSLKNNYYKYPAIVPPMNWIDNVSPKRPVISFDSTKEFYKDSIEIYFKQDTTNVNVNRYVIYNFDDTLNMDNSDPKNITEIIIAENYSYKFNLQNFSVRQNKIIIAITDLTTTNNESTLSKYVYLERKSNGWQIMRLANK